MLQHARTDHDNADGGDNGDDANDDEKPDAEEMKVVQEEGLKPKP